MPALINGYSKEGARHSAETILVRVGLQNRLHQRVGKLSGGEQQRVAVARAIVGDPKVILADEPTGSLDSKSAEIIMNLLKGYHKKGATIIIATHDKELIETTTHRIIKLNLGRIEEELNTSSRLF